MFLFFIAVSLSARLIFGSRARERLPWLSATLEPLGAPYTISYDLHPFSLGHPYLSLGRSISCLDALLVVVSWKTLPGGWVNVRVCSFDVASRGSTNVERVRFTCCDGPVLRRKAPTLGVLRNSFGSQSH